MLRSLVEVHSSKANPYGSGGYNNYFVPIFVKLGSGLNYKTQDW